MKFIDHFDARHCEILLVKHLLISDTSMASSRRVPYLVGALLRQR